MRRAPRRAIAAALATVILAGAGCSGDDGSDTTSDPSSVATVTTAAATLAPASTAASTTTAPPATTAAPATPAPTTTPEPPDAGSLLATALAALGDTYRFDATVTLNGDVAAIVSGDRVGDGSRFDVTSNGTTVSYVVLPDTTWVRQADGSWEELQDPPSPVDPIDALGAPLGVTLSGGDAETAQIEVSVAPAALGMAGDGPVTVHAVVAEGALTSVAFETAQDGVIAQIATTFGPAQDPGPVVAPV